MKVLAKKSYHIPIFIYLITTKNNQNAIHSNNDSGSGSKKKICIECLVIYLFVYIEKDFLLSRIVLIYFMKSLILNMFPL